MSINSDSTPRHHEASGTPHERIGHSGDIPVEEGGERAHDPALTDSTPLIDVAHRLQPVESPSDLDREPALLPEKNSWKKRSLAALAALGLAGGVFAGVKAAASSEEAPRTAPSVSSSPNPGTPSPESSVTTTTAPETGANAERTKEIAALLAPEALDELTSDERQKRFVMLTKDVDPSDPESIVRRFEQYYDALFKAGLTEANQTQSGDNSDTLAFYRHEQFLQPAARGLFDGPLEQINGEFYDIWSARFIVAHNDFQPLQYSLKASVTDYNVISGDDLKEGLRIDLNVLSEETVNNHDALQEILGDSHPNLPNGEKDLSIDSNYPMYQETVLSLTFKDAGDGTISISGSGEGDEFKFREDK